MHIERLYTGCLAEAAYYIESAGVAAVIDPMREAQAYIDLAARRGARITEVLETHFHADFVSGHIDLARDCGARIVFGPGANPAYPAHIARDGEIIKLGEVSIEVLHTPGHTPESCCFLVRDEQGRIDSLFSGDTLFIGDVGRPDLAVSPEGKVEDMAGQLYDSLQRKILGLPDEVVIRPGHGAGSACGKSLSSKPEDTLGSQKTLNYALRAASREEFIAKVIDGIPPPPAYFPMNARLNREGYPPLDRILAEGRRPLSASEFASLSPSSLVLDVRTAPEFLAGSVPGAVFCGLDGHFATWAAEIAAALDLPILIIAPAGREAEAVSRLARVGFTRIGGILQDGLKAWSEAKRPIETSPSLKPEDFAMIFEESSPRILDVRRPGEYASSHLRGAGHLSLSQICAAAGRIELPDAPIHLHCQSGYRSVIALSLLRRAGHKNLINLEGGFLGLRRCGLALEKNENASTCGAKTCGG
ncbi:MAG: hypothetical protein RL095_1554 [Verrucomicrobiota bacterium]|jgi:glyoxylase-like metal-dependent hydrolase (beta-lactamase superfamily II)/rhodanese-related sulfurtransferase